MPKSEKAYMYEHLLRADQASGRVTRIYAKYVEEFTKLVSGLNIDPAKVFSFSDYPQTEESLRKTLSKVARDVSVELDSATRAEWEESNIKNDEIIDQLFKGIPKEKLQDFYNRNLDALNSFQTRVVNGMNLSERIWKVTEQYQSEIEMGIDVALGEGKSAQKLSQDIRQLLKEPDNLFRRVRNKHGDLVLSQRAAAFHPGQGVYRSSYKNAMRVARSEVNMAYREADDQRWNNLPFVVGYEVKLSAKHPFPDICNDLAGKYPKQFKFRGWHPHCFCYCVSILPTDEEMDDLQQKILNGEDYSHFKSENEVKDVPDNMKSWISGNADRAKNWNSTPYFIRDNFVEGDLTKGLTFQQKKKGKTIFKTPEQRETIIQQWERRKNAYTNGNKILGELKGISDVDTATMDKLLNSGNVEAIEAEIKALTAIKDEINGLQYIVNPMDVAKQFSFADAKGVNSSVEKKLKQWLSENSSLAYQKKKLKFEIEDFLGGNMGGVQQKYKTWKVSQDAYKRQLSIVENAIALEETKAEANKVISLALSYNGKKIKALSAELQSLANGSDDLVTLKAKIDETNKELTRLNEARAKKLAKEYASSGGGLWRDGKTPYTTEEIAERQRLEDDLLSRIKASHGNCTTEIHLANEQYSDYIHKLSDKYYDKQRSKYAAGELLQKKAVLDKYLAELPVNPGYIWGDDIGGVYPTILSERIAYAKELANMTPEELSLVTRFSSGMTFSNAYNLKGSSKVWGEMWKQKISSLTSSQISDMERIIEEYTEGLSGVLDKMKRYEGTVFRGLNSNGAQEVIDTCIKAWDDGSKIWTTLGPASTSTSLQIATNFDGELVMIIKNKTGAWIKPISEYKGELEVMIRRGDKYRLLSRPYKMGSRWWIELEEIV